MVPAAPREYAACRRRAAEALGKIGDKRAEEQLRRLWARDSSAIVQLGAAAGLYMIAADRKAFGFIVKALRHPESDIAETATDILGEIGDKRAVECLIKVLKGEHRGAWYASFTAAQALGKIGKPAVAPLVETLKHKEKKVRLNAIHALRLTGEKSAVAALVKLLKDDNDNDIRTAAAVALAKIGDREAVGPLTEALKDKDEWVRGNAAWALGEIGDKKAVEPLRKLWKEDKDKMIQLGAAYGLAKITGDTQAYEFLIEALRDRPRFYRAVAARLLQEITKQNFGLSYQKWKAWYEKSKDK